MRKLKICVNSQTPLVRFKLDSNDLYDKYGEFFKPAPLSMFTEGEDYEYTPGGVSRIVYPFLKNAIAEGIIEDPHWVVLNPMAPGSITADGITLHHVMMNPYMLSGFARFKESLWRAVHNLEPKQMQMDYFSYFALYNWLCAWEMLELNRQIDFDLFYIHDFQQLLVGSMLGTSPKIFRWHIPLNTTLFSDDLRKFVLRHMQNYDAVIVSCKNYLESLLNAGYQGRAYQIYPYTDQSVFTTPSESEVQRFCDEFEIGDENIISVVARIVPMKGQDVVIKALPTILRRFPKTKLLLIGNGSFTSAKKGGLGYHKGAIWQGKLEELVKELGLEERVIFTGYLPDKELRAAYARSDVVVLPSVQEGFGLVVIEAWLYKKPTVVSSGAGVSELILEGENGYTFDPKNPEELAEKVIDVLSHPEKGAAIGEMGFDTAMNEYAEGAKPVWDVFSEVLG